MTARQRGLSAAKVRRVAAAATSAAAPAEPAPLPIAAPLSAEKPPEPAAGGEGAEVVSLDTFRKKT